MSHLTLDDAATLLLQLEAGDVDDLARLRDALTTLLFENRVPLTAQPQVARAARLLGTLVDRSAADPAAVFLDVNRALEAAATAATGTAPATTVSDTALPGASPDPSLDLLPDDTDLDLLADFITESMECLEQAEASLLELEADPLAAEAINTVFRAFHTVKGTSGFLGLGRIAAFAHEAESLLSRVRDREIAYSRACAELSLASSDMLRALLSVVKRAAASGERHLALPDGYEVLLRALAEHDPAAPAVATAANATAATAATRAVVAAPQAPRDGTERAERPEGPRAEQGADATIRVRTDRLDRLIDMVGELVIAQTMISGDDELDRTRQHELVRKVTQAGKIVRELQELSMSMRMVELRPTFRKLTRVVRDTAVKAGKEVVFSMSGDDVEIDRHLADRLGDPLVHMVRNAIDHGIERPEERERAGKPPTGHVRLHAYHASGNVVVELMDDGRGLHRAKIVAKAIEQGLIESDKGMTDSEVFNLIFAPGFSTADRITDISGRGVGMDVVRQNLAAIRGRVDITSVAGQGTTFAIRLPLTLAVTDGMLVRVGAERFVVPTTHIHMSFRPEPAMLSTVVGRGEVVLLRGELMPIARLHAIFAVPDAVQSPLDGLLMIVGDGERRTALLVDELLGQQQVVAKSLGDALGKVPGVSGGAILGDGRVGLILDVNETVALALGGDTARGRAAGEHGRGIHAA